MIDPHDTSTGDLFEDNFSDVIPRLSCEQVDYCLNEALNVIEANPFIRLGQAFINAVWSEYQLSVTFPELFYCQNEELTYKLIGKFLEGENER